MMYRGKCFSDQWYLVSAEQRYVVLKVIHTFNGPITEAVTAYRGTNIIFGRSEAEEVFTLESAVLNANVVLEIREIGSLVRSRRAQFIDDAEED